MKRTIRFILMLAGGCIGGVAATAADFQEQSFLLIKQVNGIDGRKSHLSILLDGNEVKNQYGQYITEMPQRRIRGTSQQVNAEAARLKTSFDMSFATSAARVAATLGINNYVVQFEQSVEREPTTWRGILLNADVEDERGRIVISGIKNAITDEFHHGDAQVIWNDPIYISASFYLSPAASDIRAHTNTDIDEEDLTVLEDSGLYNRMRWRAYSVNDGIPLSAERELSGYNFPVPPVSVALDDNWRAVCLLAAADKPAYCAESWRGNGSSSATSVSRLIELIDADFARINILGNVVPTAYESKWAGETALYRDVVLANPFLGDNGTMSFNNDFSSYYLRGNMRASCGTHRTLRQISSLRDRSICKVPDKYKSLSRAPKIIMKLESRTAILSCFTVLGYRERWGRYIEVRSDATSHLVRVLPSAAGAVQYHVSFSGYAEGETKEIPLGAAQESDFLDDYHHSKTRVIDSLGNNEFPLKFGVVQAQSLPAPYTERLRFGENRVINYFADNPGFANLPDFLRRAYSADLVGAASGREVSVTPELSDTLDSVNGVRCVQNGDNLEDISVRGVVSYGNIANAKKCSQQTKIDHAFCSSSTKVANSCSGRNEDVGCRYNRSYFKILMDNGKPKLQRYYNGQAVDNVPVVCKSGYYLSNGICRRRESDRGNDH